MGPLDIRHLAPGEYDIKAELEALASVARGADRVPAPSSVKAALAVLSDYVSSAYPELQPLANSDTRLLRPPRRPSVEIRPPTPPPPLPSMMVVNSVGQNVQVTQRISVDTLFRYAPGAVIEYPQTSVDGYIGHLFTLDPTDWRNPIAMLSFAYSLGPPNGSAREDVYCRLLPNSHGHRVPCIETHLTWCKVCPYGDVDGLKQSHCTASRELLKAALAHTLDTIQRQFTQSTGYPENPIFLDSALQAQETQYYGEEAENREAWLQQQENARRGHDPKPTCQGRILFDYDKHGKAFVRSADHLVNYDAGSGLYDIDYLEALFFGDQEETERIEASVGLRPGEDLCDHRDTQGRPCIAAMQHLQCTSKIRVYTPLEEFRAQCPHILVVCHGAHHHPIPLPAKTPPHIRAEIIGLLTSLEHDLPNMTPRNFIRHPTTKAYLKRRLPEIRSPMRTRQKTNTSRTALDGTVSHKMCIDH
ncbi:hypothetical protein PLICRDRAFT_32876 [Plicaturopsis crispa FD-325 SS-3]|uniref:Uncharacterized protein n=1 Tax=Plicaturopsis crispa FD-325 SS-3 TaxID=944288 RepID=A0A0C9T2P3_PLICR|nr:hypothetical protein PLICRDRAFT_32876 [Plicaturopsis crispa FD-325 SS-3]